MFNSFNVTLAAVLLLVSISVSVSRPESVLEEYYGLKYNIKLLQNCNIILVNEDDLDIFYKQVFKRRIKKIDMNKDGGFELGLGLLKGLSLVETDKELDMVKSAMLFEMNEYCKNLKKRLEELGPIETILLEMHS